MASKVAAKTKDRKPVSTPQRGSFRWWHLFVIAAIGVGCYAQTATFDFVYDDDVQIARNLRIRSFSNLGRAFSENFWAFTGNHSFTNYYRPLQTLTYMAGYRLGGLSPAIYHWVNIVTHALASLAVFWIGWGLFRKSSIALWGALLFATHPMHTESVAWIAGITDVGCGFFFFVAFAAYLKFRETKTRQYLWQAFSLVSFLVALLFKEMALTLPLLIIVLDLLDSKEAWKDRWVLIKRWVPFGGVLLVYLVLRVQALGALARSVNPLPITLVDRILTTAYFVGLYLEKLIAPIRHNAFYVFRPFSRLSTAEWIIPMLLLAITLSLAWRYLRSEGKLLLLGAWIFITLTPVLNLSGVGRNIFTERYLYIPSLGLCLLVPALVDRFLSRSTKLMPVLGTALVGLLAFLTVQRNFVWRDNYTFYTSTLAVSPDASPIHLNLGILHFHKGNLAAARREFQAVLEAESKALIVSVDDRYSSLLGLSSVSSAEGNWDQAWNYAEQARLLRPQLGDAYRTLGGLMGRRGNYVEAERLLRRALEINPSNASAHQNLGNILASQNNFSAAESEYRTALELDPRSWETRVALGLLMSRMNRTAEAVAFLREALKLEPGNARVQQLLEQIASGKTPG